MSGSPTSRMTTSNRLGADGHTVERLETTRREVDDVTILGQQAEQEPAEPRVVLDDEQVHRAVLPAIPEERLRFRFVSRNRRPKRPRTIGHLTKSNGWPILLGYPSDATTRCERTKHAPGPARRLINKTDAADRSCRDQGAPESTSTKHHDVPFHPGVRHRTLLRRSADASPHLRSDIEQPPFLRHQWLRQPARPRPRDGHGDLPHLRFRPPHPLTHGAG